MTPAPILALLLAAAAPSPTPAGPSFTVAPSPIAGVPLPPDGAVDEELTRLRTQQADAERKVALAQLDADRSLSSKEKAALRGKLLQMKVAVMTTPRPLDVVAAFYERTVPRAEFVFGVRDLAADLDEAIRAGAIKADPERVREAAGKQGRSARWTREAQRLSIAIEDHLVDPRDGRITKKTVVLVTSFGD
ncbi:MAG TPA: hypothetical protein PLB02_04645 [Thermoanaerobaculia bacterium]|nr:hypothetical protein [Thermoanaerobaculia bacterium]HQR66661.1 hypothetical protein [Thermoanaerobaculia bacterium]